MAFLLSMHFHQSRKFRKTTEDRGRRDDEIQKGLVPEINEQIYVLIAVN